MASSAGRDISDIFRNQAAALKDTEGGKMAPVHADDEYSEDSQSAAEEYGRRSSRAGHPLTYEDMSGFAADIKASFSAAITDLKTSLLVLQEKMAAEETAGKQRDTRIHRLDKVTSSHARHFIEMNRHLEDLDNRGRRNNIRVRGIPESVLTDQIPSVLQRVFNSLLEKPEDTEIEFVRAHRALRARGPDTLPPRDIICCLQSFALKEEIMFKARRNDQIIFNGECIKLFQDLSQITLKNRRALRPLLDKLREKEIRYTWRFPFALLVTSDGRQHTLRTPEDLPDFCDALQLGVVELPDWYQEFIITPQVRSPLRSPLNTPEKQHTKKQKHFRSDPQSSGTPRSRAHPDGSMMEERA